MGISYLIPWDLKRRTERYFGRDRVSMGRSRSEQHEGRMLEINDGFCVAGCQMLL